MLKSNLPAYVFRDYCGGGRLPPTAAGRLRLPFRGGGGAGRASCLGGNAGECLGELAVVVLLEERAHAGDVKVILLQELQAEGSQAAAEIHIGPDAVGGAAGELGKGSVEAVGDAGWVRPAFLSLRMPSVVLLGEPDGDSDALGRGEWPETCD